MAGRGIVHAGRLVRVSPHLATGRRGAATRRRRGCRATRIDGTMTQRATNPNEHRPCALRLADVRKSFGVTPIIRGVSLDVAKGERHAIIGPNGAGKSTLFNLISG